VPPVPSPNPLIVPTKIGKHRIHISSLHPYKSERLVYRQYNWLYAVCARQYSGQWFLARPRQEQPLSLGTSTYRQEASLASSLPYARRPFCETLPNTSNSAVTNSMSCFQTVVLIARLLVKNAARTGGSVFCPYRAGESRPDAMRLLEIPPHCPGVIVVVG
jgi:hypothetical protein